MSLKLTDILEEIAVAAPIIVEVEQLIGPDAAVGTTAEIPAVHVRIKGRRLKLGPIPIEVEA